MQRNKLFNDKNKKKNPDMVEQILNLEKAMISLNAHTQDLKYVLIDARIKLENLKVWHAMQFEEEEKIINGKR